MTQPKLITKPFAEDALPGYVNEIPKENPVGAPEQNASWSEGFPPITMTDIDDGGLPPNGEDMNGVLRAITEHNLFIGGGGVYEFTDEYITEVGGYNKGAVLISDDKTALWMSIQDNNTQNFNGATKTQWRRIAFTELDSTLASIQDALNTKADKSVTITAGDGLTGGGTLAGNRVLAVNSSVVRTDRTITAGTGLSGGGNLSTNRTLSVNYGTTAGTAAQGNDTRITGAAQKSANLSDLTSAAAARQNLGLGTAATRDVGDGQDDVTHNSSKNFLWAGRYSGYIADRGIVILDMPIGSQGYLRDNDSGFTTGGHAVIFGGYNSGDRTVVQYPNRGNQDFIIRAARTEGWTTPPLVVCHSGNILTTTGQSTQYPMTQKAVTDALNTKANTSAQVIAGTGLSGGGNLSANRTLSVNYGTTAGTAAQGNDSRINNGQTAFGWGNHASAGYVPSARTINAGTGLSGGGNLTANRTLSVNYGTTAGTAAQGNDSRIVNSVQTSGNQTISGLKTFSQFPVTPSAAPTANYQAANKKYVDDSAIGVGQNWQNMTSNRVSNSNYTNSTGSPICVSIRTSAIQASGSRVAEIAVDGVLLGRSDTAGVDDGQLFAVVPAGSIYKVSLNGYTLGSDTTWLELR